MINLLYLVIPFLAWKMWFGYLSRRKKRRYRDWLDLRRKSRDQFIDRLCYCGHTFKCSCGDPGLQTFLESVKRGDIIENDPKNGWREKEF